MVGPAWATNRYVEAGAPSPAHSWSSHDYERFAEMLSAADAPLPCFDSSDGEVILRRLLDTENFNRVLAVDQPLTERLQESLALLQGANKVLQLYGRNTPQRPELHREIANQLAFTLRACSVAVHLLNQFAGEIPRDENYDGRMAEVHRMLKGLEEAYAGAEQSLSERDFFKHQDRSLILAAMAEAYPTLQMGFTEEFKISLREKLERRKRHLRDPKDIEAVDRICDFEAHQRAEASYRRPNRYVELGAPSPSAPWTHRDYRRFVRALSAGEAPLPTFADADGEAILERLLDAENFAPVISSDTPLTDQLGEVAGVLKSTNELIQLYSQDTPQRADYHREVASQLAFTLKTSAVLLYIVDKILPSLPEDSSVRHDLRSLTRSLEEAYSAVEGALDLRDYFNKQDRALLLTTMAEVYPNLQSGFSERYKEELRSRLLQRQERIHDPVAKEAIDRICDFQASEE